MPVAFGRLHIAPALPRFLSVYPELKIDMVTTDRFVDLAEEGYDVVVRISGEPAPNLVARKLDPNPTGMRVHYLRALRKLRTSLNPLDLTGEGEYRAKPHSHPVS